MTEWLFFIEVVIRGLVAGMLYALVALGFVLIYKASFVFNFGQTSFVFFAALSLAGFIDLGVPFWPAVLLAVGVMVVVGIATERLVLRPMVGQSEETLLLATMGVGVVLQGLGQAFWGAEVRTLNLGVSTTPIPWVLENWHMLITEYLVFAAIVSGSVVAVLALAVSFTKVGTGLRAVADDNGAALSIGIPLNRIWMLVWAAAGIVGLVAGMLWGARSGVQFALIYLALKALPVLIIGGFTSVPGVIVAGLLVGVFEVTTEFYIGPYIGGGIDSWTPYALAIVFLMFRAEGLFGEKIIRRV